ncbi:MAG: hypothetical protein WCF67_10765, partial [Chitinophagaceae bacterium]
MKKIITIISMFLLTTFFAAAQISPASMVASRNKVAVIPVTYIADGNDYRIDEMRFFLQDIVISYMSNSASELKFIDAVTVNAILLRNGINETNIRQYTPKELAAVLQVEYIVMGSVLQSAGSVVTTDRNHNTSRQTIEHYSRDAKVIRRNNSHGTSVTRQNIETQVSLSIYNEAGERIYTKSRQSILSEG